MKKLITIVSSTIIFLSVLVVPSEDASLSVYFAWLAVLCSSIFALRWVTREEAK